MLETSMNVSYTDLLAPVTASGPAASVFWMPLCSESSGGGEGLVVEVGCLIWSLAS